MNEITTKNEAFYQIDNSWKGFKWIDADNKKDNIYIYQRMSKDQKYIIVLNFSNKDYLNFRMGIENYSILKEVLNTDKDIYFGSNRTNPKAIRAKTISQNGLKYSVELNIAALSGIIFEVKELTRRK